MAGSGVISEVSQTLVGALDAAMASLFPAPAPRAELHTLQGQIQENPATLAVLLYEVSEDPSTKNRPMQMIQNGVQRVKRKPPMTLILRYLIVPVAGDRQTEQQMLGRTMQLLYDNAVFAGTDLRGTAAPDGLVGSNDTLSVSLDPLNVDERSRIWFAIQQPYRLSVCYQVRVANVDPVLQDPVALVRNRNFDGMERVDP